MNGNWRREDEEDGQYLGKRTYIMYPMKNFDIPTDDAQIEIHGEMPSAER